MSTEAPSKTGLEKEKGEKRKKVRDSNDSPSSTKERRKGTEDAEEEIVQAIDTPRKKNHRRLSHEEPNDTPIAAQPEESAKKKHKKRKDKHTTALAEPSSEDLLRSHSPFLTQTTSFYLALSPCAHSFPLEGLCAEHISPVLLTYYPPLHGVVLSYSNPRVSESPIDAVKNKPNERPTGSLALSINEYAVTFTWLTADFLLFRPQRGRWLEGYVSMQNESLLVLMCYNYFNAVIPREKLPEGWKWEGDGLASSSGKKKWNVNDESGYFVDADGTKIDGRIIFQVDNFDATPSADGVGGTISITGTLRGDKENGT